MNKSILLLLILIFIGTVNATTLYGNIYDWNLEQVEGAKITINSIPEQSLIAIDGSYSFELNPGDYNLHGEYTISGEIIASSTEEIIINEEGDYRIDIILFPEIGYEEMEDLNLEDLNLYSNSNNYFLVLGVILIIIFFAIWFKKQKSKKIITDLDIDEAERVFNLIKQNGGRITQKEIRKALAMSEAKLSLIITELIHKNKIEKIKKGRGNIIILKK
jgi:uncharacterized membrane protein